MFEDITIVREILNGKYDYFDKLIDKYERIVYIFIYALVGEDSCSKEICKRVFIKVYNNLYKYNINYKLLNWILNMAVEECKLYIKESKDIEVKNSYLNLLNMEDKCILLLKKLKGQLSFNDIGEILNISELSARKKYRFIIQNYKKESDMVRQH